MAVIELIGPEVVTLGQCLAWAEKVNPGNENLKKLAWLYFESEKSWPGKPALKFAQMLKETRNFKSMLSQEPYNNLAGIGAISYNYPAPGSRKDPFDGKYKTAKSYASLPRAVEAHSAHWAAYIDPVYNELAKMLDDRYSIAWLVRAAKKVAKNTDDFSLMWAEGATYGQELAALYMQIGGLK